MSESSDIGSPFFSIVMPSYNHASFIESSIKSVLEQSFADFELIIVDDASTDDSPSIIRLWQNRDRRIRATFHYKNEGIAKTCNDGIVQARGQYILMMASDDMLHNSCLQTIRDILLHRKVNVIILNAIIMCEGKVDGLFSDVHTAPNSLKGNFFKTLLQRNFVATGVFRRELIQRYKIRYDERLRYLNDWLFWLELSAVADFLYLTRPLYYYRLHKTNIHHAIRPRDFLKDRELIAGIVIRKYPDRLTKEEHVRLTCLILVLRTINNKYHAKNLLYLLKLLLRDPDPVSLLIFISFMLPITPVALLYISHRFARATSKLIWM